MIREWIQPSIAVQCQSVQLNNGNIVLIMRVYKGVARPHQVRFAKDYRFYSRSTAGKYTLDVHELRTIYELSATTAERIRSFRAERLASIIEGDTPVPLNDSPKIVLHLIPLGAFEATARLDVNSLTADIHRNHLRPISAAFDFWSHHNFDGLIRYSFDRSGGTNGNLAYHYVQLFRNGIIESVDARIIRKPAKNYDGYPYIPDDYEDALVKVLPSNLDVLQRLGVEPPILIMLSILDVKGYVINYSDVFPSSSKPRHPTHKNDLIVPEVQIDSYECDASEVLKPIFDMIANAGGWTRSLNYDEQGKWQWRGSTRQ